MALTRIYTNPGIVGRPTLSIVIVVIATLYGVFEIGNAWFREQPDNTGLLFGIFFVGGGIYGFQKVWTDTRDIALSLDLDEANQTATLALWRPFKPFIITTPLAQLTNWRHHVRIGARQARTHLIQCDCAGYPRPIRFEFQRDFTITDGLRRLAPQAVEDFEIGIGVREA